MTPTPDYTDQHRCNFASHHRPRLCARIVTDGHRWCWQHRTRKVEAFADTITAPTPDAVTIDPMTAGVIDTRDIDDTDPTDTDPLSDFVGEVTDHITRTANRELLRYAVSRAMFCPITGRILDVRDAVLVITADGGSMVMAGDVWDVGGDNVRTRCDVTDVIDGRVMWR